MADETRSDLPFPVLPGGTVTFLFTDIEGSTQLLRRLREQYSALLDHQREILRAAFMAWGGHEVDTRGEEFFVAFPRATDAVAAAVDAQRRLSTHSWPEGVNVRVRMGIHTGEPWVAGEGYVGIDVHRAARIANVGHGGQVLLSETTAALVLDELPTEVTLLDLGRHRLKDVPRMERIRQLVIAGLPADFPPLKSLESQPAGEQEKPRHNLPAELTPFIGREAELDEIGGQLQDPAKRLLTLVGVGGMGKTRLALRAAEELIDTFPNGVWLVEFAKLRDPKLVPQQTAAALGVSAQEAEQDQDVTDVLANYLRSKKLLLLLDNCEHLVEACAELAQTLLTDCPDIQLVATSREALGIPGEVSFVVPTMTVPPDGSQPQELEQYEASRFFLDRARAALPPFQPSSENSAAIVNICRRLDGIPLAIELAAARVKILAPEQIAELLWDRFRLLAGGPRTALPRHQALRATLEWSFNLLSEPEQRLFSVLSVFAGGWSLENAQTLMQDDSHWEADILEVLSNLVSKSLVTVSREAGHVRYGMLETVHQYASELLELSGGGEAFRRRHARLFIQLAESADPGLRGAEQLIWLETLEVEHENIRAALAWMIASDEADATARLLGALGWFWFIRGYWEEAWRWLTMSLDMVSDPVPELRAKALCRVGAIEIIRGNLDGPPELIQEALEIYTQSSDQEGIAWCLNLLGQVTTFDKQDLEQGAANLQQSIELFRALGDEWGVAWSTRYLGQIAELQEDVQLALALQEEALQGFEKLGDVWNAAHSLFLIGGTLRDSGEYAQAEQCYRESYARCASVKDIVMEAHALQGMGMVELEMERFADAEKSLRRSLDVMERIGDENCRARISSYLARVAQHHGDFDQAATLFRDSLAGYLKLRREDQIAICIARFAALAAQQGHEHRAARLLGSALTLIENTEAWLPPPFREELDQIVLELQDALGEQAIAQAYALGERMTLQEAARYALQADMNS
jgi:predicted ATPase/class 3 adenylate cyclase